MFWHKRTTHKFPLLVFGLIALGIIISSTILIVRLYKLQSNSYQPKTDKQDIQTKSNYLNEEYFSQINGLSVQIAGINEIDQLLQTTKSTFLSVRVPKDLKDIHLNTFLEILKLEDSKNILTVDEVKKQLTVLLNNILSLQID